MIDLRKLEVRPGDPVTPAWLRLLEWAKQFRVITSEGIRLTRTPQGTYVVADVRGSSWGHPFKVSLGSGEATISTGTVEDVVPKIGKVALDAETPPTLKITGKPNKDGVSWVVLEVSYDSKTATVKHVNTLERTDELIGVQSLAMLRWSGDAPTQAFQVVHHNLGHHYVEPTGTRGSRHLFWAK
jgi:hypothetical protein